MNCHDALNFLDDYLDGNLPWSQRIAFGLHLGLCRPCRDYLDGYRKTINASRNALSDQAIKTCEQLPEEMVQAILASRVQAPHADGRRD